MLKSIQIISKNLLFEKIKFVGNETNSNGRHFCHKLRLMVVFFF